MNKRYTSIHSDSIEQIHEMPINEIIRPIPPQVNEDKVKSLMDAISVSLLKYFIKIVENILNINFKPIISHV